MATKQDKMALDYLVKESSGFGAKGGRDASTSGCVLSVVLRMLKY